jgi:hypothetical protein
VAGQITSFADPHIPAGATRSFRTSIPDPPFSAVTLQVDFAIGAQPTAGQMQTTPEATPQASSVPLRGPASDMPAVNATPLPAGPAFAPTVEQPVPAPAPAPAAAPATPAAAPAAANDTATDQ